MPNKYKPSRTTYTYEGALGSLAQMGDKERRYYNLAADDLRKINGLSEQGALELLMALSELIDQDEVDRVAKRKWGLTSPTA